MDVAPLHARKAGADQHPLKRSSVLMPPLVGVIHTQARGTSLTTLLERAQWDPETRAQAAGHAPSSADGPSGTGRPRSSATQARACRRSASCSDRIVESERAQDGSGAGTSRAL